MFRAFFVLGTRKLPDTKEARGREEGGGLPFEREVQSTRTAVPIARSTSQNARSAAILPAASTR